MDVTIVRSKWLRGPGDPGYLAADGRFTCLGAILLESGIPFRVLEQARGVADIPRSWHDRIPARLIPISGSDTVQAGKLQRCNMESGIPDEEREACLTEAARKAGITVTFV